MRRTFALILLLPMTVLAEEGSLPFKLGAKGFEEGETRCRLQLLHKGPVDAAAGTLDGRWLVWKVAGTIFAQQGDSVREFAVPSRSRLLGCTRDGKLLVAEPSGADVVFASYDLATDERAVLWEGDDARPLLIAGSSGFLGALGVLAVQKDGGFTFDSLDRKSSVQVAYASGVPVVASFGARAIALVPPDGKPVLLAPNATPAPLDPVLEGATGLALSPDRPFAMASTAFDVGFVSLTSPGLLPIPLEGLVPISWPSRSAILLTKSDGLYLLTLTDDGLSEEETARLAEEEKRKQAEQARVEEERRAEAERLRLEQERQGLTDAERARLEEEKRKQAEAEQARVEEEKRKQAEADQARLEEQKRAEAERLRLEQERQGLTDAERARLEEEEKRKQAEAERARLEEEKRKQAETEQARLEAEKRRLAEEERKRQEEAERAQQESELDIVDFAGLDKARLGDLTDAVKAGLLEPDQREEGEEEGTTDWIYASRGLVLTFEDETKQLVRVLAKGKPDFLPAALKDRFRPYRGKTGKGIALGASRAEIEEAYGKPVRVVTVGAAEMLRYDGEKARMSFQVERGKLVLILVQREK